MQKHETKKRRRRVLILDVSTSEPKDGTAVHNLEAKRLKEARHDRIDVGWTVQR